MILFKEKNSKFCSFCFPIENENDVKVHLSTLKKAHAHAGHFCYAYQIGTSKIIYRTNDDGEPNNTAGAPIYGQIKSFDITNVLVVVIRYFGGTKLGVGGLISAYKSAAQMALQSATIVQKTINIEFVITYNYKHINKVMRIIKEKNITIISQKIDLSCETTLLVTKKNAENSIGIFENLFEITVKKVT